jgi:hypothetical protein
MGGSAYSTYTTATTSVASSVPVLEFVGYQVYNTSNPLLSTGFTTLNFEPSRQGTLTANQWQTRTVSAGSTVWQSNATDSFCIQSFLFTLAQFAAHYPNGAWGQVQLGLGTFAASRAPVSGFVDNVTIAEGATKFGYNFEAASPRRRRSPRAATATGGTATVTLKASLVSVTGST